jgi:polysaccharide biosynthesis/export protein
MEKRRQSIFFTIIFGLILMTTPVSQAMAQEKAVEPEKKQVIELELKEKKDLSEITKEKEVKGKKAVTPEQGIIEVEKKRFEKLLDEGMRLSPELENKIREATTKRFTKVLEETIGMSPIEEAFNQRVPSFKNRLEQEIKEKILADRSLSPEEVKTLRENLEKSLLTEYNRRLERDFQFEIKQYGYNFFELPPSTFAAGESAQVGPDYVLGPGDTLIIQMWGMTNEVLKLTLTRDGRINLPKVGALYLWGMNLGDAEKRIKDELARFYRDFQINVSMGSLRTVQIFVLGEVKRPGSYTISSLSTLLHGLYQAGGPSKFGSLRNIKLIRKGDQEKIFDLYQLLIYGDKSGDVRLLNEDIIFVPPIGDIVGISGNVKNQAIYEITGHPKLSDILKLSGGLTPSAYLQKIQVERILANQQVTVLDIEISNLEDFYKSSQNIEIKDKDLILISSILKKKRNYVTIKGNIYRPDEYTLKPNMRLSELILEAQGILPETYMERAEILRYKSDYTREIIPFEVRKAMDKDPAHDLFLKEWDIVEIKSIFDIYPKPIVYISGEVHKPGTYRFVPGLRISDLLYQAQELKDTAYLEKAELYRKNYGRDKPPEVLTVNLKAILQKNREADLVLEKEDHLFIRPIVELIEKYTVILSGEVNFPGTYTIKKGEKLAFVIERAGGFTPRAFLRGAVFSRKSLAAKRQPIIDDFIRAQKRILLEKEAEIAESNYSLEGKEARRIALAKKREALNLIGAKTFLGRIIIDLNKPESKNFLLEDGDNLTIPTEPQTVLIIGEVYNPESLAFTPGKGVDFYLNKVGGPTEKADRSNIYVIKPDGQVESRVTGFTEITKGDIIIVPEKFD